MVNAMRTISPHGLKKGFSWNFHDRFRVQQGTPEESQINQNVANITIKLKIMVQIL